MGRTLNERTGRYASAYELTLAERAILTAGSDFRPAEVRALIAAGVWVFRCETCRHPMTEGFVVREDPTDPTPLTAFEESALAEMLAGREPQLPVTFFSACDRSCDHASAGRGADSVGLSTVKRPVADVSFPNTTFIIGRQVEASWRPVALRADVPAILCLYCWATAVTSETS
jgi:hypothetical protein